MQYDLIDVIKDDEIIALQKNAAKGIFILSFKNDIKNVLKSESSLKKQLKVLMQKHDEFKNISIMTYSKYLHRYFAKSYENYLNRNLFERDKYTALSYIVNEDIRSSLELYNKLLANGLLRYRGVNKIECSYGFFREYLKNFLKNSTEKKIEDFSFDEKYIDRKKILKLATTGDNNDQ